MKTLITSTLIALTLSFSALAEDIVCSYMGGAYRPVSKLAVDIAAELEIQSCQGARFKAVALQLGKEIVKKKATKAQREEYLKSMKVNAEAFKGR